MKGAVVALGVGIALLLVGLGMVAGLLPQSTAAALGGNGQPCAAATFGGCPGLVVAFSTAPAGLLSPNAITLSDHTTVGKVNITSILVNWGDGSPQVAGTIGGQVTHTYPSTNANYTVSENVTGSYQYQPTGSGCLVVAGGCAKQLLTVTSTVSHPVQIGSGNHGNGGTGGCAPNCPVLVANFSLTASGLNVTFNGHSTATGMCSGLFGTPMGTISWGDGSTTSVQVGATVTHTYSSTGTYLVRLSLVGSYPAQGSPASLCIGGSTGGTLRSNATAPVTVATTGPCSSACSVVINTSPPSAPTGLSWVSGSVLIVGIVLTVIGIAWSSRNFGIGIVSALLGAAAILLLLLTLIGVPL